MTIFHTRHRPNDLLITHRHTAPYATLVLSGNYLETSIDGPVECMLGTLVVHPSFHAHGNRFRNSSARTINISLPSHIIVRTYQVFTTELKEAREVFSHSPDKLVELIGSAVPQELADVPEWCRCFASALGHTDHSIAQLASEFGISAAYASRTMQRIYGMPPIALRREWRWRKALPLLLQGLASAEVAACAGFADQSHFTRICRQITGDPPARLRQKVKFVQDTAVGSAVY